MNPILLWSERANATTQFRLFKVYLEKGSGKPLAITKTQLSSQKLCGCSSQKYVTSPSFDIMHRNLSNPEKAEIVIGCGSSICLYDLKMESSHEMKVSYNLENKTVLQIKMDHNFVFLVTDDNKGELHIVPLINGEGNPAGYSWKYDISYVWEITTIIKPNLGESPVWHLPVPFKHCLDLYISRDCTSAKMSDDSTISIKIGIAWDNSLECTQFDQFSVAVDIDYAKIPDYLRIIGDPGKPCASVQGLECKSLPTAVVHGQTTFITNISDVVSNKDYLVDIRIKAAVDQRFYDMWYAGCLINPQQVFRTVINTKYSNGGVPLHVVLLVLLVVLLVMLVFARIFYNAYIKKMYLYKHLNRIAAQDIRKQEKLGEGNFGEVWKATLGKNTIVIKMLKESATEKQEKEFREEALLLSKFDCDNIIGTVGICLQSRPVMLALEFVNGGSLDTYLKREEVRSELQADDLLGIVQQALKACIYLEQEGYIHRDIASRNCLVATVSDTNIRPKCIKLSDFGLAKDIGCDAIYRSRDPEADTLPIAWTAPEAFSGRFSPKSDVWAFGVLIWEIFSWAATPYGRCSHSPDWHICRLETLSHDQIEFRVCAQKKNLLSCADPCTGTFCAALKTVLAACWEFIADERPTFKQLQKYINCAKPDISNADVQMCFKQLSSNGGMTSSDLLNPVSSAGEKAKFLRPAYKDVAEWKDEKKHPFDCKGETDNDETLELLPMLTADV